MRRKSSYTYPINAFIATIELGRVQKEKNFLQDKERQLYRSMLYV